MPRYVSDLSQDFIINAGDRPDGMRGPSAPSDWGDIDAEPCPEGMSRGYVERDLEKHPVGSLFGSMGTDEFNKDVPLLSFEEIAERVEQNEKEKTRISDIRMIGDNGKPIASLDQNGQGYCWAYSTCHGIMIRRAQMGLPYIRLSAHSLACKIKNFRDEGGWCGLSATNAIADTGFGYVPTKYWPEKSMSRQYDTQANWEIAKKFTITEGFMDLQQPIYGKTLTFQQTLSCLVAGIPVVGDFNHWAHSILLKDPVLATDRYPLADPRTWGIRIWNSWRDAWGRLGTGILLGKKCIPDGAVAIRDVTYAEAA
jgi:hypothetical protein